VIDIVQLKPAMVTRWRLTRWTDGKLFANSQHAWLDVAYVTAPFGRFYRRFPRMGSGPRGICDMDEFVSKDLSEGRSRSCRTKSRGLLISSVARCH